MKIRINKKLLNLRGELNKIDEELGELLIRRFQISKEIGDHKRENNIDFEDLGREREVIDDKIKRFNLPGDFVEELFKVIFKHSKLIQGDESEDEDKEDEDAIN